MEMRNKKNKTETLNYSRIAEFDSLLASDIIQIIKGKNIFQEQTETQKFLFGILDRQRRVLKNISSILKENEPDDLTSVFVLFRALMDDFLSSFKVSCVLNEDLEVRRISAYAYKCMFDTMRESAEINKKFFKEKAIGLYTFETFNEAKNNFLNDSSNNNYFSDKSNFKFIQESQGNIKSAFELNETEVKPILLKSSDYVRGKIANAHAYIQYKLLSNVMHFSNWTFDFELNPEKPEMVKECLLYTHKTVLICAMYFLGSGIEELGTNKNFIEVQKRFSELGFKNVPRIEDMPDA